MKSLRAASIIPLLGLLASIAACSGQAATDGAGDTNAAVTAAAQADKAGPHGPRRGMHGPAFLLFAALEEPIDLTADQRATIEAAVATLKPPTPKPEAKAELETHRKALAAAVRAGKIDATALQLPKPDFTIADDQKAALAKALTTLHKTLTKEQRVALVAAVQKRAAHFDGHGPGPKHGPKGGPGAEDGAAPKGGPKGGPGFGAKHPGPHFGPMGMFQDLDLTDAQKEAIRSELEANKPAPPTEADREAMKAAHEAMRKEMDARLQSFASDTFDANAFLAKPTSAPPKMGPHGNPMLKALEVIVPILTPAQREKLATKIEQGPPAPPPPGAKPAPAAK